MSYTASNNSDLPVLPPVGDPEQADKYLNQLTSLLNQDKLPVVHTDLGKFDPSSLQDHYRLDMTDYQIEISHSKQPDTGKDSFVMLFNNIKTVQENCAEKVILAYMHLTQNQFQSFKSAADEQIIRLKKLENERRLKEALTPIDQALSEMLNKPMMSPIQTNDVPESNTHTSPHQDPAVPTFNPVIS